MKKFLIGFALACIMTVPSFASNWIRWADYYPNGLLIDTSSIVYENKNTVSIRGKYVKSTGGYMLSSYRYYKKTKTFQRLSIVDYDEYGNILSSIDTPSEETYIPPNTEESDIYDMLFGIEDGSHLWMMVNQDKYTLYDKNSIKYEKLGTSSPSATVWVKQMHGDTGDYTLMQLRYYKSPKASQAITGGKYKASGESIEIYDDKPGRIWTLSQLPLDTFLYKILWPNTL